MAQPSAEPVVLRGHADAVYSVAFSADGAWLASGSRDNTVRLWSVAVPAAEPVVLRGHEAAVLSVAFSADEAWLASGSLDSTVRLWSVAAPAAEPVVLRGHEAAVWSVAFSADGAWLASGSSDNTVRLWRDSVKATLALACTTAGRNLSSDEWQSYFGEEQYRRTCNDQPLHPSLFDRVTELIENGQKQQAISLSQRMIELAHGNEITRVLILIDQAVSSSSITLAPQSSRQLAQTMIDKGLDLAQNGEVVSSRVAISKAIMLVPDITVNPKIWNEICWQGTLSGMVAQSLDACEQAVSSAPENGYFHDSRGLARALIGDIDRAIADFTFAIQWAKETGYDESFITSRQRYVDELKAGKNPFTAVELQRLREE